MERNSKKVKSSEAKSGKIGIFWPGNLVSIVMDSCLEPQPVELPITEDQKKGIDIALSRLTPEEKNCVLMRFKDGLSVRMIAQFYRRSPEWVRTRLRKAMNKLQRPLLCGFILNGYNHTIEECKQANQRKKQEAEKLRLEVWECQSKARCESTAEQTDSSTHRMPEMRIWIGEPIIRMNLSHRAYTALYRGGCNTVEKVIRLGLDGGFGQLRGAGVKTVVDIVRGLYAHTGVDLGWIYSVSVDGIIPFQKAQ